jgi:hypothetical protein
MNPSRDRETEKSGSFICLKNRWFCETTAAQLRGKIYGNESDYKLWVTGNIGSVPQLL